MSATLGILDRLLAPPERRGVTVVPEDVWRSTAMTSTAAGVAVTPDKALRSTAVYACVRILAETTAMLPLILYRRRAGVPSGRHAARDRATDHALYPVLHDIANPEMTAYTLRETLQGHVALRGNAFAEIEISGAGEVTALWPLRADRMHGMERRNGSLFYIYELPQKVGGGLVGLPEYRVLHVRGLGNDGLWGYSPIALARQAVGLALATEEFGSRFFGNGARPGMVLEHPGNLSEVAQERLKKNWEDRHQGLDQSHRIAILEEGMKVQEIGIAPEEAQFLETRKFQVTEIARLFRIPPHMLADLERATFSNIEHLSLEFVIFTLMPWLVRWEQEISRSLLTPSERPELFARHLVTGLLRGDTKTRFAAYAVGRQWGWLSADDVREMEDMNPLPDGQGEQYLVPYNMALANQIGQPAPSLEHDQNDDAGRGTDQQDQRSARAAAEHTCPEGRCLRGRQWEVRSIAVARARHRLMHHYLGLYQEAAGRIIRRERNDVGAAVRRFAKTGNASGFESWAEEFYREHGGWAISQVKRLAFSYGEQVAALVDDELGQGGRSAFTSELLPIEETLRGVQLPAEIERFVQRYLEAWGLRHSADSLARLRKRLAQALADGEDWEQVLLDELDEWCQAGSRPDEIATDETVRFNNAVARTMYLMAGVTVLVLRSMGKSCAYCSALDGTTVSIEQPFVPAGTELQPDGADRPLVVESDRLHPPIHRGCDCMAVAGRR